jgi:hypothetical protein
MQKRVLLVQVRGHELPVPLQQRLGLRGCSRIAALGTLQGGLCL